MRTGLVTASYLDPLAVRIQSVRPGKGRGWRRFLVFTALTKGRKGSEYVALFTYFSFEAWTRVVLAEGPRQVINALTLWSVLQAELIPVGEHAPDNDHTAVAQFFVNVQILAKASTQQATILFGMLYVLIIWAFSALSLIIAFLMYITFLWHHIPSADGSLSKFCQRKVEKRLNQIVRAKVDKAIAREHIERMKKVATGGTGASVGVPSHGIDYKRQPTLPVLETDTETSTVGSGAKAFEARPASPFGTRPESPFNQRPSSPSPMNLSSALAREPMLPSVQGVISRPDGPSRDTTQSSLRSNTSFGSDAPLMGGAAPMGHRPQHPQAPPSGPSRMNTDRSISSSRAPPSRSMNGSSQSTTRSASAVPSRMGLPLLMNTEMSATTQHPRRNPMSRDPSFASSNPSQRRQPGPAQPHRRPTQEYEMHPPTPIDARPPPANCAAGGYKAFNPFCQRAPYQATQSNRLPPKDYFGEQNVPKRAGTAPVELSAGVYDDSIYDAYGASQHPVPQPTIPFRPATAGSGPSAGRGWNAGARVEAYEYSRRKY